MRPPDELELRAQAGPGVEAGGDHGGDVGAGHLAALHLGGDLDQAGARVVGEGAGAHDRPVQAAVAHGGVGVALGRDVRRPDLGGVVGQRVVDADRGDLHVAADAGQPGPLHRLQGALEVDGALALDVAVGAAPGREHDGVAPLERGRERRGVVLLDVEQADLGAEALELGAVVLPAHQRDRGVPGGREQRVEVTGHVAVAPDDGDASHAPTVRARWSAHPAECGADVRLHPAEWAQMCGYTPPSRRRCAATPRPGGPRPGGLRSRPGPSAGPARPPGRGGRGCGGGWRRTRPGRGRARPRRRWARPRGRRPPP